MSWETLRRINDYNDAQDRAMDEWADRMSKARDKKLGEPELKAAADTFYEQCKTLIFNGASNFRRSRTGQLTFDCALPNGEDTVIPEVVIEAVSARFQAIGFGVKHSYNDGIPIYDNLVFGLPPDWVQRLTSPTPQNK